jgi:hypothetical protein
MKIVINMHLLLEAIPTKVLSMHVLTRLALIAHLILLNHPPANGRIHRTRLCLGRFPLEVLLNLLVLPILKIFDQKLTHVVGMLVNDAALL